jgi:anthranilate phosphoribosyltransferase
MIKEAISKVVDRENLASEEASVVMSEIMRGEATPSQISAFLTALRMKGETVEEIVAFAKTMRSYSSHINPKVSGRVVDTCGTGGDKVKTVNVSTIAALVVAGAGVPVAKHGNRSVTSNCGSADLLEGLGVNLNAKPKDVERSIEEAGIGFMFAPVFHPSMKHVSIPRREVGIRTVFNILGPLTNPANAKGQLVGVYDDGLVLKVAQILKGLGVEKAIVAHGLDGVDEISVMGKTHIAVLEEGGEIHEDFITPLNFGVKSKRRSISSSGYEDIAAQVSVDSNILSAFKILRNLSLSSKEETFKDMVLENASATLVVAGLAENFVEGFQIASKSLESGRAYEKLVSLVKYSKGDLGKIEQLLSKN